MKHSCKLVAFEILLVFSYFNIAHEDCFYSLHLADVNSLVGKNSSCYNLRKTLNIAVLMSRTEQGRRTFKHRAGIA